MTRVVYKVCDRAAWQEALAARSYAGSADDLRDGFIHLSLAHQLEATLCKYFAGRTDRYEPARNGDLFPHLYAALDPTLAREVVAVHWQNGKPVLGGIP